MKPLIPLLLALAASSASGQGGADSYLCCNLRRVGDWISDSNYLESGATMVPFGTPVRLIEFGRYRVHVEIAGQRVSIGNDYSRDLPMEVFARRYLVARDPRPAVAELEPRLKTAIESGRVARGMTREQVIIALGYPISSETPHLDARTWRYWLWTFSPYTVSFDEAGRVTQVDGAADTLRWVYMP